MSVDVNTFVEKSSEVDKSSKPIMPIQQSISSEQIKETNKRFESHKSFDQTIKSSEVNFDR